MTLWRAAPVQGVWRLEIADFHGCRLTVHRVTPTETLSRLPGWPSARLLVCQGNGHGGGRVGRARPQRQTARTIIQPVGREAEEDGVTQPPMASGKGEPVKLSRRRRA